MGALSQSALMPTILVCVLVGPRRCAVQGVTGAAQLFCHRGDDEQAAILSSLAR